MDSVLYTLPENIRSRNYVVASYYIKLPKEVDVLKKAASLAIGQTIGTWIPIPGITEDIRERYMGKVVNVFDIPALDLETQVDTPEREYMIQIAYPAVNFGSDFPLMLTSLLGNDASTSAQVKLLDIEFPREFAEDFGGPNYGIAGIRKYTGIVKRPLLLNMIKPCTGLTPKEGARIFYETALGGVDLIKDDELFGNPTYSKPWERVKEYKKAAAAAYEETGERVRYFVNVTSGAGELTENVKRVQEAGADGIMINFAAVGYSGLKQVAETAEVPILGHAAGSGMFYEGTASGMSSPLAAGKLARLAGADIVMVNTPYGGYPLRYQKYMQTLAQLTLPWYDLKPSMPSIGGGVHPGMVEKYMHQAGNDIVLAAGGAVQGHPMGARAGARAMRQAIEIVMEGRDFAEASGEKEELSAALRQWEYIKG
ncbi:RuBisCO large subunit C-terminal-like domain-containing protein [Bariatricus massiliensis]|uniref:Transcriptional regulator n=1 Tax=Bariatricus massiliensis TaxID=1745713 RepID=A0ABS8DGI2_9FIRM|nr:RuBisCO large subunit C-terminal-like domain-containing protein [Bariatricus massiliensis]MCB7304401.1 transcriptional regulator [Bariatricus massiliensis]MCB7375052.1 transcriptional regulator [Bariatricus massiliensis]MCB7387511.1 transcriptional regulator [Bariatricus massiliensis]MCB7411673.1 transcriptional regulator [Bariatricus massiliensis]MCQ5253808.1 RuBisCO large subunit C-terminal-like domain-containing protein [Bariatricus massiliensis]